MVDLEEPLTLALDVARSLSVLNTLLYEYIDLANYAFRLDFETLMPKAYAKNVDTSEMHMVAEDEKGRLRAQVAVFPEPQTVCDYTLRTC